VPIVLLTVAIAIARGDQDESRPTASKRVAVLIYDGVAVIDFAGPLDVLAHAGAMYTAKNGKPGFDVFTVAVGPGAVKALTGATIVPERVISDDVKADILIIPGGANQPLMADADAMSRLARLAGGAEIRMSVCNGAWILGALGLLDDVQATATSPEALQRRFPRARVATGRRYVDAGSVITTPEGVTGIDGALRIVERYFGRSAAEQVAAHMGYPWAADGLAAAHAGQPHTIPDMPPWRRFYLGAIEKLRDDADPKEAVRWLGGSFERGHERPSQILSDPAFVTLRNDPARRGELRKLLAEHAREHSIQIPAADEPGEPPWVSGTVRDSAGQPIAGALIYVYHTDRRGYYSEGGMDESNPRMFGYMKTGPDGRYDFRTIRPGHYPDQAEPVEQHIHYEVTAPGYLPKTHRLAFSDHPLWSRPGLSDDPFWRKHAPFPPQWTAPVQTATDGVARCECDLTLQRE